MARYEALDRLTKNKKLVLFGASSLCSQHIILRLRDYKIAYICDNDKKKWNTVFFGIPVKSPEELFNEPRDSVITLITTMFQNEVASQLLENGVPYVKDDVFNNGKTDPIYDKYSFSGGRSSIKQIGGVFYEKRSIAERAAVLNAHKEKTDIVYELFSEKKSKDIFKRILEHYAEQDMMFGDVYEKQPIYFNNIFSDAMTKNEIYIDAGFFDGDSIIQFIRHVDNNYKKIRAFEANPVNYWNTAQSFCNASDKIDLVSFALSDKNEDIEFCIRKNGASESDNFGKHIIKAVRLDDFAKDGVTFIKMNIGGSEYEALLGATEIIKKHRPKLAVSIYHKHEDIFRLPLLLNKMVPEYKFFVRHHDNSWRKTILYAKI